MRPYMIGTNKFKVKVVLRNPLRKHQQIDYTIVAEDSLLARDWLIALKSLLKNRRQLEKNFCFLGFPYTARDLRFLSNELQSNINVINNFFDDYKIEESYKHKLLRQGLDPNQSLLNKLHNHFERLQGTVENLSDYYRRADHDTKYAIRQLNLICHEMESLMLSQRKLIRDPEWVRPSQITTWLQADRYLLKDEHRQGFLDNGFDREFGGVYMHWTQIGKTLFEVWRDENAPKLDSTVCEAITHLKYYSGEFDIDWGRSCGYKQGHDWHDQDIDKFTEWLVANNLDPEDTQLSLGYLKLGQVDLMGSFGTTDPRTIWKILGDHLDIYRIEYGWTKQTYDYCWNDKNYKQQQIDVMRPGYDYSSR